ncbi:hypothetical protein D3C77_145640 [compost metagenome]
MLPRFVIVPAMAIKTQTPYNGFFFNKKTIPSGYDIYDNKEKKRLKPSFKTKNEAEAACQEKNIALD